MLIAGILGLLTGIAPAIIRFFEIRQRQKYEVKMLELRYQYAERAAELDVILEEAKADAREGASLRNHDMALRGGRFIEGLRASVRPIITYAFFIVFAVIKTLAFIKFYETGTADFLTNIQTALGAIWDEETAAIFAAIMGFWFGQRTIERMMGKESPSVMLLRKRTEQHPGNPVDPNPHNTY